MNRRDFCRATAGAAVGTMILNRSVPLLGAQAGKSGIDYPIFEPDATFPQLPNGWVTGHVSSVAAGPDLHVWLLTRPFTVPKGAKASPPVLHFDEKGVFIEGWGGHADGYDWPDSEHGIDIDYQNNVWIGGSSPLSASPTKRSDDMYLKFTSKGKFIKQLGGYDRSHGNNKDTASVCAACKTCVDAKTNEVYIADGYGNRRILVLDANTFAYKRSWGAFSNEPIDVIPASQAQANALAGYGPGGAGTAPAPAAPAAGRGGGRGAAQKLETEGPGSPQFGSPVHDIKMSNDRILYVTDRSNRRVQLFTPEGKYLTQVFINRGGPSAMTASGIGFSPDKEQRFLYISDQGNNRVVILDRKSLAVLYQFGGTGAKPGQFQGLHQFCSDLKGNLYAGEVAPGARAQRFIFKGLSKTLPPNALTTEQLAAV
jgi:hypothetical protein